MKPKHLILRPIALLNLFGGIVAAAPLGTAFTYQGRLIDGGSPANGSYDVRFTLFDTNSGGSALAGPLTNSAVAVSNGLFTATLDFSAGVFDGSARWLELAVRANGGGAFATLGPRQPLTAAPYALYAPNAGLLEGLGTNAFAPATGSAAYVARAGDTMTGPLRLPTDGLSAGSQQLTLTNGRVGIGALNPQAPLHVNGAARAAVFEGSDTALPFRVNGVDALRLGRDTNGAWLRLTGPGGSGALSVLDLATYDPGTNTPSARIRATDEDWSSSLDFLFKTTGANTNGLVSRLRLRPNGNVAVDPCSSNDGVLTPGLIFGEDYSGEGIASKRTFGGNQWGLGFYTGYSNRLTILNNGNVGIGTTIPTGKLEVIGSVTAAGDLAGERLKIGASHSLSANWGTIAGGQLNTNDSAWAVLGGGQKNWITNSMLATLSGGWLNRIHGSSSATVGGGTRNVISNGYSATIGGGANNEIQASAYYAVIPGGAENVVAGAYSFAAGHRAKANHGGAFVWADSTESDLATTANDQFLIRAAGGVGIGTNNPASALHVVGTVTATGFIGDGSGLTNLPTGGGTNSNADTLDGLHGSAFARASHTHDAADISSGTLADGQLGGTYSGQLNLSDPNNTFTGSSASFGGTISAGGDLRAAQLNVGSGHSLTGRMSSIAGGLANIMGGDYDAICAGQGNLNEGWCSIIGAGRQNSVQTGSVACTLGGGEFNTIEIQSLDCTVGGGDSNNIGRFTDWATIGGGSLNTNETLADFGTIAGGGRNLIQSSALYATIGGGRDNTIKTGGDYGTIPGGDGNVVAAHHSFAAGLHAVATNSGCFVWADGLGPDFSSTGPNQFLIRAFGNVGINTNAPGSTLDVNGTITAISVIQTSDRHAKEHFAPVNVRALLGQVATLPIQTWSFRNEAGVRHIGPVAQDFHAAFGMGPDDRHITTLDADGVALAAIQGLNELLEEKDAKIRLLEERLAAVEKVVQALGEKHARGGQ